MVVARTAVELPRRPFLGAAACSPPAAASSAVPVGVRPVGRAAVAARRSSRTPDRHSVASRSVTVPAAAFPRRAPTALLAAAREGLAEATHAQRSVERYALAHVAALRCAAAVLAARARPGGTRRGPTNAWALLTVVAPELGEWAAFFAAGAMKRSAAEAGQHVVSDREADDLLRDAQIFLSLVETTLGAQPILTFPAAG